MRNFYKKDLIRLILIFIITFSLFSLFLNTTGAAFGSPDARISLSSSPTSTSVSLIGSGVTPMAEISFSVKGISGGITTTTKKNTMSDAQGNATISFTGLTPNVKYIGGLTYGSVTTPITIEFTTPAVTTSTTTTTTTTTITTSTRWKFTIGTDTYGPFKEKKDCEDVWVSYEEMGSSPTSCVSYTITGTTTATNITPITVWRYTTGTTGSLINKTYGPFKLKGDCDTNLSLYKTNNVLDTSSPVCTSKDERLIEPLQVLKYTLIDNPVSVSPTTSTNTSSDVYTLLAPIGGMDTAPNDMGDYFNKIFLIAIGLCGALAVVMLIIGGIQYMGEDSVFGKTKAKEQITSAVFGLLIALGAYALLNTINPALLGRGGINIKSVTISIDSEIETEPWTGTAILTQATKTCTEGYENVQTTGIPKTINVCKSISGNLTKMLAEAAKKGFVLSGSGSRTYEQQKALRIKNNCKPDILTSPSKSCTPETARPGFSKHESGKAVDFNCAGEKMKGSVCFNWLVTNAKSFGFYNLSGEPWHWSDNGH